jgi:hypothetical protein
MPEKKTVEYTIYKFDELDDKAKEKARDWWRRMENMSGDNFWTEYVIEDAEQCAKCLGIEIDQRSFKTVGGHTRYEPKIWWSGFSSQGDGACFEGSWEWPTGQTDTYEKRIKDHAPQDEKLHRIALTLDDLQQRHSDQLRAVVKHSGHYYHSGCTEFDIEIVDCEDDEIYTWTDKPNEKTKRFLEDCTEVKSALRAFMDWIYSQLQKEYEYRMSDVQIDECIRRNEYDFFEDGRRATV